MGDSESSGLAPRRAAAALVTAVTADGRLLSDLGALTAALPPEDRARAQRLAAETLRGIGRADRLLRPHLARMPALPVLTLLRLGLAEMAAGAAAHGVVNDLVEIAGQDRRTLSSKGLVNAVLRKCAAGTQAAWAALPPPRLPDWLRKPLVDAWGARAVAGMEAVAAAPPPVDLTPRGDAAALAALVGGRLLPTGSVRLGAGQQVSTLPGYAEGQWWVQDAAAALPAQLLDPRPGERVLDLCAAPGGKTMQLAAAGAAVTAVDASDQRLGRLRDNLDRTGLAARVVTADAMEFDETGWDAVLLDAPCSATGTIRRHPDLPFARDGRGLQALATGQRMLIDRALQLLAPGGRLVFCTCSLLPDEGEAQTVAALSRHPGLTAEPATGAWVDPAWQSPEGGLRLRPDQWAEIGGIDGFYMVRLRKPA